MKTSLHDSFSRDTMLLTNDGKWGSDKDVMCPTRSEANSDLFTDAGKIFKKRASLEYERRFFDNKRENTFAESNTEFSMKLIDRDRDTLVLDKRTCWSRSAFDEVAQWNECKTELKDYCIKHHAQKKHARGTMNAKLMKMSRVQNT